MPKGVALPSIQQASPSSAARAVQADDDVVERQLVVTPVGEDLRVVLGDHQSVELHGEAQAG